MRRGINLSGVFDGDPAVPVGAIDRATLDVITQAGFDTLRLPVRWTAHTEANPPFMIDETFMDLVHDAVVAATGRGLEVVVDVHHAHDVTTGAARHERRFAALWRQIAERYAESPPNVVFELLNEPRQAMTAEQWNRLLRVGLEAVRGTNPHRRVMIGPARMNTIGALSNFDLPNDPNLVATVHYYEPFEFTHQGAAWESGASQWLGRRWGSDEEVRRIRRDLEMVAEWARHQAVPMVLGEFGTYERADFGSRVRWTHTVRVEAERLEIPWCYWDFATDFGVFDLATNSWRTGLRDALLDR